MKKLKRKICVLLSVVSLATVFSGCGSTVNTNESKAGDVKTSQAESGDASQSGDEQVTLGTLKFGIMPGTVRSAVVLVADYLGYYEEEGLTVEFVESSDPTAALTSISLDKGEMDIWGVSILPQLNFIANGSDLVIFSGTAAEGGAIVATPENAEHFKTFGNYENITVATTRGDPTWVVTRNYLQENGVDVSTITVKEVDSAVTVAEAVNKGEAQVGFMNTWYANSYDETIDIVYEVGELVPMYVCCRQAVSRKTLETKNAELVAFTRANIRALEYYENEANRDEIVKYLAEYSGQTEEYIRSYLFENRTIMTIDPNKEGVTDYYNSLVEAGYFTGDVDIADHVTTEIYDEALTQLIEEYPDNTFFASLKK